MYNFSMPLEIRGGNLYSRPSPGGWVIDTGLHNSSGNNHWYETCLDSGCHRIPPRRLARYDMLGGFMSAENARIGCDLLNKHDACFDLCHGTLYLSVTPFHDLGCLAGAKKVAVDLLPRTHTPVLEIKINKTTEVSTAFVTGAHHSYAENLEGMVVRPIGRRQDFHVSCGRFNVDLHEVTVTVGSVTAPITFATEPGTLTCPAPVAKLLKATGTQGILGWEILKHSPMAYLPRRGELWI